MQKLNFTILLHIFTFPSNLLNVTLHFASHQYHHLIHHLVQEVNPSQAHLSVDLVSFRINQCRYHGSVSLCSYQFLYIVTYIHCLALRLIVLLGLMLVEQLSYTRVHVFLDLSCLELD